MIICMEGSFHKPLSEYPLVSVIIPVFNGAKYLSEALQSVQDQHYPHLEIIVVDDGSTDDTQRILESQPPYVHFFSQENQGPAAARNKGIFHSGAEFVAFLDADDVWPEGSLEARVKALLSMPDWLLVRGQNQLVEDRDAVSGIKVVGTPKDRPFLIGGALFRRHVFDQVGRFNESFRLEEDLDWIARANVMGIAMGQLDTVTLYYRRHDGNAERGKTLREVADFKSSKLTHYTHLS